MQEVRQPFRATIVTSLGAVSFLSCFFLPSYTETAIANGDTRTIHLYHAHTHEMIDAKYRVNGEYDPAVLKQLNWFLRDWRRDEPTSMDPRLFDVVWEVYRSAGAGSEPVTVMSAYRSPETNAMLRRRSRAVAEHSQHMLGKAMDTSMPGMSMEQIREVGMRMQRGGVGYYPTAGTPFVHLDVGSVRSWPRMSYDQLVRLFPDGKTVHLPSNGQPLARYEEARAEIAATGGVTPPSSRSTGFFAWLFGGGSRDGDDEDAATVAAPRVQVASRRGRVQMASMVPSRPSGYGQSPSGPDDAGTNGGGFFSMFRSRPQPTPAAAPAAPPPPPAPTVAEAETNLPRGETFVTPAAPAQAPTPAEPRTTVAALAPVENAAPADNRVTDAFPAHPAPPRRPVDLAIAEAPLPPARPLTLASLSVRAALPSETSAFAADPALRRGADPIGALLNKDVRPAPRPTGLADGSTMGLRAARNAPSGTPIVSARLDGSNFRAMTAHESAARTTTQTVSGPTLTAARSAARAGRAMLAPDAAGATSGFGRKATELSSHTFVDIQRSAGLSGRARSED